MPRGGKRSGSGRKATKLAVTGKKLKRVEAEEILAAIDERDYWLSLLNSTVTTSVAVIYPDGKKSDEDPAREFVTVPDSRIRLDAIKYLTDRRDGKPAQAVHHSGETGGPVKFTLEVIGAAHSASA